MKQREELAAFQAEEKELDALRKQHDEQSAEVELLLVRAPIDGTIILRDPDALLGTYASAGTEIVSIGDEQNKELRLVDHAGRLGHVCRCGGPHD